VGKTSLLLALHFALFGEPLYRGYDYLLREDANVGKLFLEFEHGGRNYRLTRTLRRERGRINQDTGDLFLYDGEKAVAYGKIAEVRDYVRNVTGIDRKMFEEFIWIQQEHLKEILSMPPRDRQAILDHLFGLLDFKKTEEKLASIQRDYQRDQDRIGQDPSVLTLIEKRKQHNYELAEKVKLQKKLDASKAELEAAEKALKEAEAELRSLEAKGKKFSELKERRSALITSINDLKRRIDSLTRQIERKKRELVETKKALEELKSEERSLKRRLLKSQIKLTTPEQLREVLKELNEQSNALGDKISRLNADIERAKASLETLRGEKVCPTCRRKMQQRFQEKLISKLQEEQSVGKQHLIELNEQRNDVNFKQHLAQETERKIAIINIKAEEAERKLIEGEQSIAEIKTEVTECTENVGKHEAAVKKIDVELTELTVLDLDAMRRRRDEASNNFRDLKGSITNLMKLIEEKNKTLALLHDAIRGAEGKLAQKKRIEQAASLASDIRLAYREIVPLLRRLYVANLRQAVQSVVDTLTVEADRNLAVEVDDEYTPTVTEAGFRRDVNVISGGERTWLSLAYRIGLGQLIMEARTGQSLEMLILDEPTESLGSEDRSIEALATAISNLKMIRQIITVTHSEELSRKASTRILVSRQGDVSRIEEAY